MPGGYVLSEIQQYYTGKSILITGATGFLGKILLEKLLRSCWDIETIYLLIRPKKGKSSQERLDALFDDVVFDLMRKEFPEFKKKIAGVFGDVMVSGLGVSTTDRTRIINEVSVIFHVAATVRFDEPLKTAIATNVNSVKGIIELGRECKNLQAGLYVSTAYSCVQNLIEEKIYTPPMTYEEINDFIEETEKNNYSDEVMQSVTKRLTEKWPNTYAFSKAIAEGVVAEYATDLPFGVIRPSIILGSWKEPMLGWTNTLMSHNGVMIGISLGVLHALRIDGRVVIDVIPVDMVCNCLIAGAWDVATTRSSQVRDIPVYNCVSGTENPITWDQLANLLHINNDISALNHAIWYDFVMFTKSRSLFAVQNFLFHLMPALLADFFRRLRGKKPMYYQLYCKGMRFLESTSSITIRGWHFKTDRVQNLSKRLESMDKSIFPFSVRSVVWKDYLLDVLVGLRKYVLKQSDDTRDEARHRRNFLRILHYLVCLLPGCIILWITWKLFRGRTLSMLNAQNMIRYFIRRNTCNEPTPN